MAAAFNSFSKFHMHAATPPSPWIQRWSHLLAPEATVLDVACGPGRHMRWFHARGHAVTGVDRDAQALAGLQKDFAFVARCNIGDLPLDDDTTDRLSRIAARRWLRFFARLAIGKRRELVARLTGGDAARPMGAGLGRAA